MHKLPQNYSDGERLILESKIMVEFLYHEKDNVLEFAKDYDNDFYKTVLIFYENINDLLDSTLNNNLLQNQDNIKYILGTYNYNKRLSLDTANNNNEIFLSKLLDMEKNYKIGLLPPPMPSEYVSENLWIEGNSPWIGHGYYWKSGEGEMNKDLSFSDYDILESNYKKLTKCNVITADYNLLRNDFECLQDYSDDDINKWIINQSCFISEGQIKRCQEGGDMFDLIEPINDLYDTNSNKIGVRMKGGGRASTFLINDSYSWNNNGQFNADMIEVKGCGTTILQPNIEKKACGFLSLVDALKEFAYEKLIHRISEIENQSWGTVQYYAIIDTGISYKSSCENPATGYKGDRCVLVLRQRQSRIISCSDEIVYYSVVRRELLTNGRGYDFCKGLLKHGISSEQLPFSLSKVDNILSGDWNVQFDATLTHAVDFSHFYVLPHSKINIKWKLSEESVKEALLLGGQHFKIFNNPNLQEILIGEQNKHKLQEYYNNNIKQIGKKYEEFGSIGLRKPSYSWSWFLEVDNSWIMNWALKTGTSEDYKKEKEIFKMIKSILP